MKTLILTATAAAAAALTLAAPLASSAQDAPSGSALWDSRCKFCHESGTGPAKDALSKLTVEHIIGALTTGPMQGMAAGMSDADKKAIATYLTNAGAGAAATTAAPASPATPAAPATPTPSAPATNSPATPQ
jgi:polyvinyl alcohol dehydrogenase (cytochrome)